MTIMLGRYTQLQWMKVLIRSGPPIAFLVHCILSGCFPPFQLCVYIYSFWHCHPNSGTERVAAGQDKVAAYSIVNKRAVLRAEANEQSIRCTPTTNWRVLYCCYSKFWHQNPSPLVKVQAQDASILSNLDTSIPIAHKLNIILQPSTGLIHLLSEKNNKSYFLEVSQIQCPFNPLSC